MQRLLVLLCILLFVNHNGSAQTMTTEKGLTTVVFDTKYAIVSVYLPDDLQNGDKIFGTYNVYTAGITDEQLAFSLEWKYASTNLISPIRIIIRT